MLLARNSNDNIPNTLLIVSYYKYPSKEDYLNANPETKLGRHASK